MRLDQDGADDRSPREAVDTSSAEELMNQAEGARPLILKTDGDSESDADHDLEFYDRIKKMRSRTQRRSTGVSDGSGDSPGLRPAFASLQQQNGAVVLDATQIEFKDFLEPNLIKTGHIIPVSCGHNGNLSQTELTIYEIHLTNAGFVQDFQAELQAALAEDQEEGTEEEHEELAQQLMGMPPSDNNNDDEEDHPEPLDDEY